MGIFRKKVNDLKEEETLLQKTIAETIDAIQIHYIFDIQFILRKQCIEMLFSMSGALRKH